METSIDMCFTSVINPWYSEDKASLRFQQTLQNLNISETLPYETMLHSKFRNIISKERVRESSKVTECSSPKLVPRNEPPPGLTV